MLLVPARGAGHAPRSSSATAARRASSTRRIPTRSTTRSWVEYVFMRDNPKGPFRERWVHSAGCRRWFVATRDTVTHEFLE